MRRSRAVRPSRRLAAADGAACAVTSSSPPAPERRPPRRSSGMTAGPTSRLEGDKALLAELEHDERRVDVAALALPLDRADHRRDVVRLAERLADRLGIVGVLG